LRNMFLFSLFTFIAAKISGFVGMLLVWSPETHSLGDEFLIAAGCLLMMSLAVSLFATFRTLDEYSGSDNNEEEEKKQAAKDIYTQPDKA